MAHMFRALQLEKQQATRLRCDSMSAALGRPCALWATLGQLLASSPGVQLNAPSGRLGGTVSTAARQLLYLRLVTPPATELMAELGQLRVLDLSGSDLRQLPQDMSSMSSLQHLDLSGCRELQQLPNSLTTLAALQQLQMADCIRLQQLPSRSGVLTVLQVLNLSGCQSLQRLPDGIGSAPALQQLLLPGCKSLRHLHAAAAAVRLR